MSATFGDDLAEDMARRWGRGERPTTEDYLGEHPELATHPAAVAALIDEELCLRELAGEPDAAEGMLRRFPQWREQIEVLLACRSLLTSDAPAPDYPGPGETLGDFDLIAELGCGAQSRVLLARERSLGGRAVVLKLVPTAASEHLSLAQLQHTNIVPLYSVVEHPDRGLRALCMPYDGGLPLDRLLALQPPLDSGADLLAVLGPPVGGSGLARRLLASSSYETAIVRIGVDLAEALHYAHERALIHLDLKPSNVLIAADGAGKLLDFHLARAPLAAGDPGTQGIGGTTGFMSPEQSAAWEAIAAGRPVPDPVDARSDIYSFGLVLREATAGRRIGSGLRELIDRCTCIRPCDRYPDMAAVAVDLRRHAADFLLLGVRNRDPRERWSKWRRRRPHGLRLAALWLTTPVAALTVLIGLAFYLVDRAKSDRRLAEVEQALGRQQPAELADRLHRLADRVRFAEGIEAPTVEELRTLEAACHDVWNNREALIERLGGLDAIACEDLFDLITIGAELSIRLAEPGQERATKAAAEARIAAAEVRLRPGDAAGKDRAAWEHDRAGRALMQSGRFEAAAEEFEHSLRLRPRAFWPQFYAGVCAYRLGRHERAVAAFSVCAGAASEPARCFYNRALAYKALAQHEEADGDFARAFALDPDLATRPEESSGNRARSGGHLR